MADDAERRDDAQPVEDRAPGRDRRRHRADRLLALQRRVPDAHLRRAAGVFARRLEPARVPAARGLRLRRQPVQLHRDRRQPHRLAGADGQHRRLEARVDGRLLGLLRHAPAPGGRAAGRRHQPRLRARARRSATPCSRARISPASTSRARRPSSTTCGGRSGRTSTATAATRESSGETGGKDFILAHPSADVDEVVAAILRGSFEYQGQKCSAASRVYVPASLWPAARDRLGDEVATIRMGDVADFGNFMGAVIDDKAFAQHRAAIEEARAGGRTIVAGGDTDDSEGYFVSPTVIETTDPGDRLLRDELFGPDRHRVRLSGLEVAGHARAGRHDVALRAHGSRLLARSPRARGGGPGAPLLGRELLRQRQADGRGRRPAALRRRPCVRHERQGRARCGT